MTGFSCFNNLNLNLNKQIIFILTLIVPWNILKNKKLYIALN